MACGVQELNKRSIEQECQDLKGQLTQLLANLAQLEHEAEPVGLASLLACLHLAAIL